MITKEIGQELVREEVGLCWEWGEEEEMDPVGGPGTIQVLMIGIGAAGWGLNR